MGNHQRPVAYLLNHFVLLRESVTQISTTELLINYHDWFKLHVHLDISFSKHNRRCYRGFGDRSSPRVFLHAPCRPKVLQMSQPTMAKHYQTNLKYIDKYVYIYIYTHILITSNNYIHLYTCFCLFCSTWHSQDSENDCQDYPQHLQAINLNAGKRWTHRKLEVLGMMTMTACFVDEFMNQEYPSAIHQSYCLGHQYSFSYQTTD